MSRSSTPSARPLRIAVKPNPTLGARNAARGRAVGQPETTSISALSIRPRGARWMYVIGHGAGAGMRHEFLEQISAHLAERDIATLRYQFPYMEAGRKRPDHERILKATVRAVIARARRNGNLPLLVGGKSMGGRMTSLALAEQPEPDVAGLAFLGFPLHRPGQVSDQRADHLRQIKVPMMFVQGTRDSLAGIDLMRGLVTSLGRRSTLHIVDGGDHSFKVLKRSGRDQGEVLLEIADAVAAWGARFGG